jgi:hypothetical protein
MLVVLVSSPNPVAAVCCSSVIRVSPVPGTGWPQGTRPNPPKWVYNTGGEPQWGNQEWHYYTDRAQNVSADGRGNLAISARRERLPGMANCRHGTCDITSGRITTKGKFS